MMKKHDPSQPVDQRIPIVSRPSVEQAEILKKATLKDGTVPNALATMAHNAELLKRFNVLGGYFSRFALLPERTIKLVILRTAHKANSLYAFAEHRQMALKAGLLTLDEVNGIVSDTFAWSEEDKLYLTAVDEFLTNNCIGDTTWGFLAQSLPVEALLELALLIGFYQGLAGFLNSVGIVLEQGVEDHSWPAGRVIVSA